MKEAVRHLDNVFKDLRSFAVTPKPPKGWVRAVRDAIGMTGFQLAARMGVEQPRISEIEKAELSGGVTLRSLERVAEAMGCRFVYALIPERPLAETLRERAEARADRQLEKTDQTMLLEKQFVNDPAARKEMREMLVRKLLEKPSSLWDET